MATEAGIQSVDTRAEGPGALDEDDEEMSDIGGESSALSPPDANSKGTPAEGSLEAEGDDGKKQPDSGVITEM